MNAIEERDFEPLAAEYALGTLDADERAEVAARRQREVELDRLISEWEGRLTPLQDGIAEVAPPPGLFEQVEARISSAAAPAATPLPTAAPTLRADDDPRRAGSGGPGAGAEVVRLRRRVARWRATAVAASIALAGLIGALVYQPDLIVPQPTDARYVAVFQDDDQAPRFLMSVDLSTRQVTIRPVAAQPAPEKAYQLWIVAEGLGEGPQSLGLLDDVSRPTQKRLAHIEPAVLEGALFGISLEPPGGSPTGKPTGPALHGTLIPTATDGE